MYKTKQKTKNKKGFVLLFAVLISSLVLAVGISVINISVKQIKLSGSGRESQFAFYASNTGAECAYYWDLKGDPDGEGLVFATSSESVIDLKSDTPGTGGSLYPNDNVSCMYYPLKDSSDTCETGGIYADKGWCTDFPTSGKAKTKFRIKYDYYPPQQGEPAIQLCADVIVEKKLKLDGTSFETAVTSRGYNTCDDTNPRRVERALVFTY